VGWLRALGGLSDSRGQDIGVRIRSLLPVGGGQQRGTGLLYPILLGVAT
jgi:hypothetical protein